MTFAYPWAFFLIIPALVFLTRRWLADRRESLVFSSVTAAQSVGLTARQRFNWLPAAMRLLAVSALIFALARPQVERLSSSLERDGVAIELLVDVSSSMDMRIRFDRGEVSRLFAAKEVLRQFIAGNGEDLSGRPNDLIGMISFARYADTICPLTLSHDALVYLTENLTINDRPNEDGTAYGDATALAAARLSKLEQRLTQGQGPALETVKSKIIVLLTDGENNCGRMLPTQAAALAKEWGIRIYTISLTNPPRTQYVQVEGKESIEAARARSSAERGLEQMAEMTGGIFRTAHDFDTLQAVYEEIDHLERSKMRSALRRVPEEQFQGFAAAALVFLALELILRSTWLRRIP